MANTTINVSTPQGWRVCPVTQDKYEMVIRQKARDMVRETGYHVVRMVAEGHKQDEEWSRSVNLYRMACNFLRMVDVLAEEFILNTFCPKF